MTNAFDKKWGAAILVIGDEILSGRTQDTNTNHIARFLTAQGIDLGSPWWGCEKRSYRPECFARFYDFVFTTGGIGPTHDDITADVVAAAFGVSIGYHPEVYALLEARYPPGEFNDMRKRMARIPTAPPRYPIRCPPRRDSISAMSMSWPGCRW